MRVAASAKADLISAVSGFDCASGTSTRSSTVNARRRDSAWTMRAVGNAANKMVDEVRRQFREITGLMEGKAAPDTARCVQIATDGAIRQMVVPGVMAVAAPILAGVGVIWLVIPRLRRGVAFFILFALAVTAAVRLVGVYVVFSSLILPALAVNKRDGPSLGMAWASAGTAVLGGILVSSLLDLPAGPVLVVAFAASALIFRLALSRRRRFA